MTDLNRRKLVASGAACGAALAAGPAAAQSRRRYLSDDDFDEDDLRQGGSAYRRPASRDPFYDTRPDPYGRQPSAADPYDLYPFGGRRSPAQPAAPGPVDLATAGPDGAYDPRVIYARRDGEPFPVGAFNYARVAPQFWRREVAYRGGEAAGSIVVDPRARHLYLVLGGGRAVRYGVGVGRQGFAWSGLATVNSKQAWPDWYPPREMIERDPRLSRNLEELQSGIGMHGGPGNPLGARALYLWQGNKDTLYRIHGTVEPWTIGTRVSSGCIRMINQDAIDIYARASVGAPVTVLG